MRGVGDGGAHPLEVGGGRAGEREVDDGAGPTARQVADQADVAVGDDVGGAVDAAEAGEAHRHVLDDTGHTADGHRVADVVLVLHRHEDAREVVAHDLLCAEPEGGADDGGAGQERGEVDAEHAEHDGARHDEDEEAPDVRDDTRHRGDAGSRPGRARTVGGLVRDALEEAAEDLGAVASDDEPHDDDEEDAQRADHEIGHRRRRPGVHAELGEQVVEPAPALVDLVDRACRARSALHQGTGRRQGGRGHGRYSGPESAL